MSKRKTGKDDSTPHENEEMSERQSNGKRDKKKQKKARREQMEASTQTEKKTHKRKRGEAGEEDGTSGYNDRGPKDSIKQGSVSSKDKDSKKKEKKSKKRAKKVKKAPRSEDEDDVEKLSEAKAEKTKTKKKASKKEKEKKKSKKEKKAKSKATEEEEKASNGDSAKEKEVEAGASSATSSNGSGSDQQGGAGWNNWEASSFGDDARKNKFLRLMGAKKTGTDNPSQPPQKKGLFGSLRATAAPMEPSAIDSSTERKITLDLTSQFQDALQRRNCRGGIGLDSGTKKSDRSAEPQPHPYAGGKASTKLHIDDYPKSIKFDD